MKRVIVMSILAILAAAGAALAMNTTQSSNTDSSVVQEIPSKTPVPNISQAIERPNPISPSLPPFEVKYEAVDFTGKRGGAAGNLELSITKGVTKAINVEIIPLENLKRSATFDVDLSRKRFDPKVAEVEIPGVDITFAPQRFTVNPGQRTSFVITIHVRPDAPDGAYLFQYQITSDVFQGKYSGSFDLLVGDTGPLPIDNPPKERPPP